MKNPCTAVPQSRLCYLLALIFILLTPAFGQKDDEEYKKKIDDKLATLDLTGIKTTSFLNKGVFSELNL